MRFRACLHEKKHLTCQAQGWEVRLHLPILCFFISRLHDERNTTGIVKSHLTRGGISPGWGENFPCKRNTTGMVRWIEYIRWFSLVSSSWFHGEGDFTQPRLSARVWQGAFPHINGALGYISKQSSNTRVSGPTGWLKKGPPFERVMLPEYKGNDILQYLIE